MPGNNPINIPPGGTANLASTVADGFDWYRDRECNPGDGQGSWSIQYLVTDHDNEKTQNTDKSVGGVGIQ